MSGVGCGCGGAKCRLAAGDGRHGTSNGYARWGCRCSACRAAQSTCAARYRAENAEKLRASKARYRAENAEKLRASKARYRAEHAEKARASRARYYAENREKVAATDARYRAENAERIAAQRARYLAENREKVAAKQAHYNASPEGRASRRAADARRRARKKARDCGCCTTAALHTIWARDAGRCAYCGGEGRDYEHVVPLVDDDGWHCVSNLRVACQRCNSRKWRHPLSVLLARLRADGVPVMPDAEAPGLPCAAAAARVSSRMLTA